MQIRLMWGDEPIHCYDGVPPNLGEQIIHMGGEPHVWNVVHRYIFVCSDETSYWSVTVEPAPIVDERVSGLRKGEADD